MTSEITEAVVEAAKRNLVNVDIPPGALPFGAKWCDVIVEAVLNATLTRADRTSQPAPDKEAGTGRKMVPIEPNETMVITAHGDEHCGHVYDAMIGAALPPPSADRNNIEAVRLADDAAQK